MGPFFPVECLIFRCLFPDPAHVFGTLPLRKQNGLWADGDVFREKVLKERENGKMTRILSGVDDISINGCNKNKSPKKEELELVSLLRCSAPDAPPPMGIDVLVVLKSVKLFFSTTMKRSKVVSRRETSCVP